MLLAISPEAGIEKVFGSLLDPVLHKQHVVFTVSGSLDSPTDCCTRWTEQQMHATQLMSVTRAGPVNTTVQAGPLTPCPGRVRDSVKVTEHRNQLSRVQVSGRRPLM